jgi:hypothetical protein
VAGAQAVEVVEQAPELPLPAPNTPKPGVKAVRGAKWHGQPCSAIIRSMAKAGFTLEQVQRVNESLQFGLSAKTVQCQHGGHASRGEYAVLTKEDKQELKTAAGVS